MVRLELNTQRGTQTPFLTPEKYAKYLRHFYCGVHPGIMGSYTKKKKLVKVQAYHFMFMSFYF